MPSLPATRTARRETSSPRCSLGFHTPGGPLLAIVSLCGGAGASTLTALTSAQAARESRAPILAVDTGGPHAALHTYAGARSALSLAAAAAYVENGQRPPSGLLAGATNNLRVIAAKPEPDQPLASAGVLRIIGDAVAKHGLTVIDCSNGTRPIDRLALESATHIAWVLPATASGVERAAGTLDALPVGPHGREVIVARRDQSGRAAPLSDIADIADEREATLALMPHVPDLAESPLGDSLSAAAPVLAALGTILRR